MGNCLTSEASVPNLATWLFKWLCSHRMNTGVRFPTCWHSYKTQIERVNIKSRLKTTDKLWEVQKHSNAVQAAETSIGCRALQVINTRMLKAHILAGWIHTMLRSNCQFTHSHDACQQIINVQIINLACKAEVGYRTGDHYFAPMLWRQQ